MANYTEILGSACPRPPIACCKRRSSPLVRSLLPAWACWPLCSVAIDSRAELRAKVDCRWWPLTVSKSQRFPLQVSSICASCWVTSLEGRSAPSFIDEIDLLYPAVSQCWPSTCQAQIDSTFSMQCVSAHIRPPWSSSGDHCGTGRCPL